MNDRKKKAADEKRAREEEYEESKEQMEVRKLCVYTIKFFSSKFTCFKHKFDSLSPVFNVPDRIYMLYYLKLAVAWHPAANISCILKARTSSTLYMYHTEMQNNQSQQQRSAKEVFNVQEMWRSPKTFPTVIHGLALCFITWHLHWDSSPHLPTRDWTPVNCHQYPEFLLCC